MIKNFQEKSTAKKKKKFKNKKYTANRRDNGNELKTFSLRLEQNKDTALATFHDIVLEVPGREVRQGNEIKASRVVVSHEVECLPRKYKALSSSPSTTKRGD
jgi:hypothetical protein